MGLLALPVVFLACDKVDDANEVFGGGKTIVKVMGGGTVAEPGTQLLGIDFVSTPSTITGASIRRDVPNAAELNKPMTIIVKDDTAAVTLAAREAGLNIVHLNPAWYTVGAGTPKTGGQGGTYTVSFREGEAIKDIEIIIPNATVFDPSKIYGLGFTIMSADADGVLTPLRSYVLQVGAKNAYDGIYTVESGLVTRYTAPNTPANDALSGDLAGNPEIVFTTVGATTVSVPSATDGGFMWAFGNNSFVAGIDGLTFTVDPATNLVTARSSGNTSLTNWAGKVNRYDPATKTFYLAFRWNPTANVREYEVVLKYKGPR